MKSQLKTLLLLLAVLTVAVAYAVSPWQGRIAGQDLEKISFTDPAADTLAVDTLATDTLAADTLALAADTAAVDTTAQRILLFGDSMLEKLRLRFYDYAARNGHDLHTVVWYSSSTKVWAETDTLQYFINKVKPTYIVVCLGSNELFVRDLQKRDAYIARILNIIGPTTPYVWISPPNWKNDTGINALIQKHVGAKRYFDSRHLQLERDTDGAHPTFAAAAQWMDLIAKWLVSPDTQHPIRMDKPTRKGPRTNTTMLAPPQ